MAKRLFVVGDGATDGSQIYCGGPDLKGASDGLRFVLESHLECLLDEGGESDITLIVKEMTDEEVEALPDV
jgi:hypothetical protein